MLISIDWIRDFVPIPEESPQEIAEKVTLATAEVESFHALKSHFKSVRVAQIKSIRQHPQADRLKLVSFDDGQIREVVCGADNAREGLKVAYAPVGIELPGGLVLETKKIRGQISEGMLCSAQELGLEEGENGPQDGQTGKQLPGIIELPGHATVGQSLADFLQTQEDIVLDIDHKSLTHRPDLWGHYGLARECATIWEGALANPYDLKWKTSLEKHFSKGPSPLHPKVDRQSSALSYWALSVTGVRVEQSPHWMQERLNACGMRPINSLVDISNYVMLELGIPNHIFDRDMIRGETVNIRGLRQKRHFITLDNVQRELLEADTVIADENKTLAIAGIMGGQHSEVTEKTDKILIEVANWKAHDVRRTCHRLGLRTESSQRYEKSLDGNLCYRTLLRILQLILELNPKAKVEGKAEYAGIDLQQISPTIITTSIDRINNQLGSALTGERIQTILHSLGFKVVEKQGELSVTVPSYRATKDIEIEADIVEEVGRIMGYAKIVPAPPLAPIKAKRSTPSKILHRKIQDYLVLKGRCLEVMTYPLVGKSLLQKSEWPTFNEELILTNAISVDQDRMRPSLIPSLLNTVALNQKYHHRFQFFELGRSYLSGGDFAQEYTQLAMAFFDHKENRFQQVINESEGLLRALNIPANLINQNGHDNPLVSPHWVGCHPHEYQHVKIIGKNAGAVLSIHPLILKKFKIKGQLSLAVIDFTQVEQKEWAQRINYLPLPKYPSSTFDCTVVCDLKTPIGDILDALKKVKGKAKYLSELKVAGVFVPQSSHEEKGKQTQQKFVTLRAIFSDPNQTLGREDVKNGEDAIVEGLEKAGFPLKP